MQTGGRRGDGSAILSENRLVTLAVFARFARLAFNIRRQRRLSEFVQNAVKIFIGFKPNNNATFASFV
jgi:hypothetical protein